VAVGHAVRAMYLYSAMADLAMETGDRSLADVCRTLWNNVTEKQMYVTGSIGSTEFGEAFSFDYDLPNDTAYNETCAAIGLVFWAHRMLHMDLDSRYADVMERALYNGVLSGISLDGTRYFYVNPLEVWPEACRRRRDKSHVAPTRQKWFGCACCPPNIARLLASFPQYVYSTTRDGVYVHIYTSSRARVNVCGQSVAITQSTAYPWQGTVEVKVSPERPLEFTLSLRVPGWCRAYQVKVNGSAIDPCALVKRGYVRIRRTWQHGDKVDLTLAMPVERVRANPAVRAAAGKVAIQRGPLVYCLEEVDNGPILTDISIPRGATLEARFEPELLGGVVVVTGQAQRTDYPSSERSLYTTREYPSRPVRITAIPYFAWDNREPGEMLVWIREA
ncbi:MAG: beta-L-arabinofuranosidase domain-containing protein, partial [Bacillota bacterium]